jgi:hypothetical protein
MSSTPVVAGKPLIELLKLLYLANVSPLVIGRHSIGKSQLLEQAARELGIGCIVLDLSLMEPVDLVGLPHEEGGRTVYSPPADLPSEGAGLLVLEELNRCSPFVRAPALQLLSARRLNGYVLPPQWLPCGSINPSDDSEGCEVHGLHPALLSRFDQVYVQADRGQWLAWAKANDIHKDVVRYVAADPDVFNSPESNPRSWTHVSAILHAADGYGSNRKGDRPSQTTLKHAVAGKVGAKRAAAFFKFLKGGEEPLQPGDVLIDYPDHRDQVLAWVEAGRLDPVKATLQNLETLLQARVRFEQVREDGGQVRNLAQFLVDLPGDLREQAEQFFRERGYEWPTAPSPKRRKKP